MNQVCEVPKLAPGSFRIYSTEIGRRFHVVLPSQLTFKVGPHTAMLQYLLSVLILIGMTSLALAAWRLATGVPVERVSVQVSRTGVVTALLAALGFTWFAVGPASMLTPGIGLLNVGLTPNPLASERTARMLLGVLALGSGMLALAAFRLRKPHQFAIALSSDLTILKDAIHSDWQRLRGDDEGRALIPTMLILVLLGTAARLLVARYPISYDESTTIVWFASRSPLDILTDYSIPNNHILHTLLVHFSRLLFGGSELAGRLPALTAGVLLIPVSAWIGWKWFGARVAMLVAALVAAFPPLLEYSAQARGYSVATLLVALSFLALLYALESQARSAWLAYAVCLALSLFTITTTMMGVYFIGAWMLFRPGRTLKQFAHFVGWTAFAGALTAALYMPAVAHSGWRSILSNTYVQAIPFGEMPARLAELAVVLRGCWAGGLPNWLAIALALVTAIAVVVRTRGQYRAASLMAGLAGMCAVVLLVNRTVPPERSFVVVMPLMACAAAVGINAILVPLVRRRRMGIPMVAVGLSVAWLVNLEVRARSMASQAEAPQLSDQGNDRIHCCATGFYPDAEPVAVWATGATSPTTPVVVHAWDGLGETIRFYMVRDHLPILRLHRFDHRYGFAQLADYDSVFVVSRGSTTIQEPDVHAAGILRMPIDELRALYTAHGMGTPFRGSAVVALVPREGMAARIAESGRQINRLDYPR